MSSGAKETLEENAKKFSRSENRLDGRNMAVLKKRE